MAPPRSAQHDLLREFVRESARLRELAASATTARVRARLLEQAQIQERLAVDANDKEGSALPPWFGI